MSLFKEPCGGCGEIYYHRRCLGCLHEAIDWSKKQKQSVVISDKMLEVMDSFGMALDEYDWQELWDVMAEANIKSQKL